MLIVTVHCECGDHWAQDAADEEILDLHPNANNIAIMRFRCPRCTKEVPVEVEMREDRKKYIARHIGGHGNVAIEVREEKYDLFHGANIEALLRDVIANYPENVFLEAIQDLEKTLQITTNSVTESQTLNRMIFNQLFAILETYLSDRLLRLLEVSDRALSALVSSHSHWKRSTISFEDAFDGVEVVRQRVMQELVDYTYHSFAKVDPIYKAVFMQSIFANDADKALFYDCVQIRHDCVHRNGKTTEGRKHTITADQLTALKQAILRTHAVIEKAYIAEYKAD
jgi:hypothetical protein